MNNPIIPYSFVDGTRIPRIKIIVSGAWNDPKTISAIPIIFPGMYIKSIDKNVTITPKTKTDEFVKN